MVEGKYSRIVDQLIGAVTQGSLLLENGELLFISPNWRFLISVETILPDMKIPPGCEIISTEDFATEDEQLQHSF